MLAPGPCAHAKIDVSDVALTCSPQGRVKETRKHRRQQGEKEREAENARTEAADLASQLRKVRAARRICSSCVMSCLASSPSLALSCLGAGPRKACLSCRHTLMNPFSHAVRFVSPHHISEKSFSVSANPPSVAKR